MTLRPTTYRFALLIATILFCLTACDRREAPQVDDDQVRQEIQADYIAVQQSRQQRYSQTSETIAEARLRVDAALDQAQDITDAVFDIDQ